MDLFSSFSWLLLCFFFFFFLHASAGDVVDDGLSRLDFPPDFVFGAGTSAFQVEGAAAEDGRKPSTLDSTYPDGAISSDQYHKYKEDVKLMHKVGLDAYRFSISWSRLIPDGRGAVNPKGLEYYNNLIDELVSYGIEPHVTLVHFDYPQALEDEYEGLRSPKFIEDFTAYADVCFQAYGDRVKSWITFNEPNTPLYDFNCTLVYGSSCPRDVLERYRYGHNRLLSHAAVVHLYRKKYQEIQKGQIGITLMALWYEPLTSSTLDIAETNKALDFELGWYLNPLVYGRYPAIMRKTLGAELPNITEPVSKSVKGSFDFIGLNHYFGVYVRDPSKILDDYVMYSTKNSSAKTSFTKGLLVRDYDRLKDNGADIQGWGLQKMLEYVKEKYKNPKALIHENGFATYVDDSSNRASRKDTRRIEYLRRSIRNILPPLRNGSNVKGYFMWSFIDSYEMHFGYASRYGLYGVDFNDENRKRYPRLSAHWYSNFLAKTGRKRERPSCYV